jgi:hypothetical protein
MRTRISRSINMQHYTLQSEDDVDPSDFAAARGATANRDGGTIELANLGGGVASQ